MLIELLWVCVCRVVLSLDQNGIENVLILSVIIVVFWLAVFTLTHMESVLTGPITVSTHTGILPIYPDPLVDWWPSLFNQQVPRHPSTIPGPLVVCLCWFS